MLHVLMDQTLTMQGTQIQWHSPKQKVHMRSRYCYYSTWPDVQH